MPFEADACELMPHPAAEDRTGPWVLILADEEDGMYWNFANRDDLETWLRTCLSVIADG